MLHLTLAGLSEDNKRLLLVSDSGEEFSLAVDDKLRAALRGEHARLGQLEIQMESTLRPRDIQARIRAGESPESVAQAAHTTVEKILPFANPVLAEREHMAQRAQRSSVRRRSGDSGARTLGEAVAAQFSQRDRSSNAVEWDAWRRDDGRWTLTASYLSGKKKGTAKFTFDPPGNYVTMENDEARWLVGEAPASPARDEQDDLKQARQRRLAAVPEDELPLGEDAISLVTDGDNDPTDTGAADASVEADRMVDRDGVIAPDAMAEESTLDLSETARSVRDTSRRDATGADPVFEATPEPLAEAPRDTERPARPARDEPQSDEPRSDEPQSEADQAPQPARKASRKKGRASVPSWDEIMFGGGKQD